ncbi:MAG: hypothetical protein GY716_22820 [bacterium]|nr:hypothetical protein [bacterium]
MQHALRSDSCARRAHRRLALAIGIVFVGVCLGSTAATADAFRGGALYDKWWAVNAAPEPTMDHPLYPPEGSRSGSTTHRCKECHGWDYKGVDGAYGIGSSHFTGISGVFGSTLSAAEMFDLIKSADGDGTGGTVVNGHGFGALGLSDADIDDLVEFLQTLVIDTDNYIDAGAQFIGDAAQGDALYNGAALCAACHGANGTQINFGTTEDPVFIGTVAVENPWEFIHKVRFGQPDGSMPSYVLNGGTNQDAADIGLHAQSLPTGGGGGPRPDVIPTVSEWGALLLALGLLLVGVRVFTRS